jgi:hypothetical protein
VRAQPEKGEAEEAEAGRAAKAAGARWILRACRIEMVEVLVVIVVVDADMDIVAVADFVGDVVVVVLDMSYAVVVRVLGAAGDAESLARFVEYGDLGFEVLVCRIQTI